MTTSFEIGGRLREPDLPLLRAMIDAVPLRVSMVTPTHRYLYANREFLDFVGRGLEGLVGRTAREVLGDEVYAAFEATATRVARGEPASRWEGWIRFARGGARYLQVAMSPYAPGGGEMQAIFVFARDLTELKERETELKDHLEALRSSEALNSAVVATSLDCVIVTDERGCVVEFNPAAETTFGRKRADVIGEPIGDLIVPHHLRAAHTNGMERYKRTGTPHVLGRRVELEAMHADGTIFPIELTVTEVKLPDRRLFTAHLRDLSEARRAATEIQRQRDRIHQMEKLSAMGSLLAGVAHELNNPLAIVMAQASLLQERANTEDLKRRAERIYAAAERSGRIVKSFLAMARQKPPVREALQVADLVRDALEMTAYGMRSAGIEVVTTLAPKLPLIEGDRDLLQQVIANLLINAQQVLQDQPNPRRIFVTLAPIAGAVSLEIADNGPGVPETIATKIFDPFFTTKPTGVGTGIGLSICRNVVEAHGGRIGLDAREGGGAVFRVVLPIGDAAAPGAAEAGRGPAAVYDILVVDDDLDVGRSLAETLEVLGHRARLVDGAEKALALIDENRFDAVFADLRMPGVNGVELRRAIVARDARLGARTVIVTGDTVSGPLTLQGANVLDAIVLEKPFTRQDVIAALDRVTAVT